MVPETISSLWATGFHSFSNSFFSSLTAQIHDRFTSNSQQNTSMLISNLFWLVFIKYPKWVFWRRNIGMGTLNSSLSCEPLAIAVEPHCNGFQGTEFFFCYCWSSVIANTGNKEKLIHGTKKIIFIIGGIMLLAGAVKRVATVDCLWGHCSQPKVRWPF